MVDTKYSHVVTVVIIVTVATIVTVVTFAKMVIFRMKSMIAPGLIHWPVVYFWEKLCTYAYIWLNTDK